jgi:ParB-like chromosome segregation protein Spo0J
VGYGEAAPDQLVANPRNWRIHPTGQQEALLGVLREVGIVQDVLVNRATGFVVDGHLRVMLALREGQPAIPVKYVELTPAEEALVLATFDPLAALAGMDKDQLGALLQEVEASDAAVQQLLNDLAAEAGEHAPDVEFPEFDEDAADEVAWLECPACGHRWPK